MIMIARTEISRPLNGSNDMKIPPIPKTAINPIPHAAHPGARRAINIPTELNTPVFLDLCLAFFILKVIKEIKMPINNDERTREI